MPNKQLDFRDAKWFAKSLKLMTKIASEGPRAEFYSGLRRKLPTECDLPLKKGKFQSVYGSLVVSLSTLSWESMTNGATAILKNDLEGWVELRRGFLYDCWAARFRHAFIVKDNCYDAPRNPGSAALFEGKEALTLCHAIATGDDEFAHGFGNHLIANFQKTNGSDKVYFYTQNFFPFVLKLYSLWVGKVVIFRPDVANPLGRYQQIFDHWESPSDLATVLLDVCDLHCEEAIDTGGYPAFVYHPYNIFPVEIMSIFRIRRDLGLETPSIDHPLLKSALLSPPKSIPVVEDPLLDRAIGRFRSDFPEGSNCW